MMKNPNFKIAGKTGTAQIAMKNRGYADERGGREYNLALGQKRSEAVKQRLQLLGIPAERIEAVSFGREKPVAYGHSEEAWAQNRRADIVYPTEVTSGKAAQ